jgi:hypothetical protein
VFTLPKLREKVSADAVTVGSSVVFAVAAAVPALSDDFRVIAAFMAIAGWAWLACLSTFNVTAQFAIAEWVKSRGLAMYQIAFFGALALGSIVWGQVAAATSLETTLLISSAAMVLGCLSAAKFKLAYPRDLQAVSYWPEPHVLLEDAFNRGVILTAIEYDTDPADATAFLEAIDELASTRRRNGAYAWGIYEDIEKPGRFVEQFLTDSWLEHLRHHERMTVVDRAVQERVNAFHRDATPPRVMHWAAPGASTTRRPASSDRG